jgi:hypothetical protein
MINGLFQKGDKIRLTTNEKILSRWNISLTHYQNSYGEILSDEVSGNRIYTRLYTAAGVMQEISIEHELLELTEHNNKIDMSKKYYKVIKDNFLWEEGGILEYDEKLSASGKGGYQVIDSLFKKHEDSNEYISADIIEDSPDFFERVYKVDLATRVIYETKEKAKELIAGLYKNK